MSNGTVVPEHTEWHNIVARRDQATFVEKWVKKGSGLYVEGKIRTRSYDDQNGVKRYVNEIYADRIEFYNTGTRPAEAQNTAQPTTAAQAPVQQPQASQPAATPPPVNNNPAEDLPF